MSDSGQDAPHKDESNPTVGSTDVLIPYLAAELNRYVSYHNHKENMAYLAVALYLGTTAAITTTESWPPESWTRFASVVVILFLYVVLRQYMRYTLERRRWAAMGVTDDPTRKWEAWDNCMMRRSDSLREKMPRKRCPAAILASVHVINISLSVISNGLWGLPEWRKPRKLQLFACRIAGYTPEGTMANSHRLQPVERIISQPIQSRRDEGTNIAQDPRGLPIRHRPFGT